MFKSIGRTFLTGFFTIVPVVLTLYLLYWLAVTSENVMGGFLQLLLPDIFYFPGLGMLMGLMVVFLIGLLMKALLVQQLFDLGEQILFHLPLIKNIYRAIRDLFDFFTPKKEGLGQVVAVTYNNMEVIGFITQTDQQKLPESFRDQDKVLVYIPMSYMIGGFTIFIDSVQVRPLNMSLEEAMRFALTAGITGKNS
ncbi:MAG: DUF502 domain-containing protein [Gammaproteobacteria bacterium]|nr:DUF502 domain-containing protein [Gammaproteobacteria bacterium]